MALMQRDAVQRRTWFAVWDGQSDGEGIEQSLCAPQARGRSRMAEGAFQSAHRTSDKELLDCKGSAKAGATNRPKGHRMTEVYW